MIDIAAARRLVAGKAQALGDGWVASFGSQAAYGIDNYEFADLSNDSLAISIRVWVYGREVLLAAHLNSSNEFNTEAWGYSYDLLGHLVGALALGDYLLADGVARIVVRGRVIELVEWQAGPEYNESRPWGAN